jgi:putative glycosyltransferase (TIGR04372 family)
MKFSDFFFKHYFQIKNGGLKIFLQKILIFFLSISAPQYVFAIFIYIFIKLFSLFLIIRFQMLRNDKIGHYTVNIELYLAEQKNLINKPQKLFYDFFIKNKKNCNFFLLKKRKKILNILPNYIFEKLYKIILFFGDNKHICGSHNADRDINNVLFTSKCSYKMNKKENNFGNKFLKEIGVPASSKFICLNVRDTAYYGYKPASDYRNSKIENHIRGIKYLLSRGYYVFRMGSKVEKKIVINDHRFFDYATNGMRSDFLDIFLGSNCYFCITTGSGFDGIAVGARKPTLTVSFAPINYFWSFNPLNITIFKHYRNIQNNKRVSLDDVFKIGVSQSLNSEEFLLKGLKLEENSEEEILDAIIEMDLRLSNKFKETKEYLYNQKLFFNKIDKHAFDSDNKFLHGKMRSRIGCKFLSKNKYFLNL